MDQPVVWAMAAMVCYGISDFVYKQAAAAGIRPDHFLMAQAWFFCPLVAFYALATGTLVATPAALWGSLAGMFVFIGFYFFLRSLAAGAVSTNASIFRLNFVVTAALAIAVLGEPLTRLKLLGLALALVATHFLVGAERDGRPFDNARRRSLVQIAIATLAFGASNFFHTVGLRHGALPQTLAVAQAALFAPLATAGRHIPLRRSRRARAVRGDPADAAQRRARPGQRAGADRADGLHRRRPAGDIRTARARHAAQGDRPPRGACRAGHACGRVRARRETGARGLWPQAQTAVTHAGQAHSVRRRDMAGPRPAGARPHDGFPGARGRGVPRRSEEI